jgi:hypothetical protein
MLIALLTALGLMTTYPRAMEIVEIDNDVAVCVDAVGMEWEFTGPEDLEVGDIVICTMYDNRTKDTIVDDEIVDVVWSGYYFEGNELYSVGERCTKNGKCND